MLRSTVLISIFTLAACSSPISKYQDMTLEQKQAFMEKYEKDMMKVHSLANRSGTMTVVYKADAASDTISSVITLDMALPGGSSQMSTQMKDIFLETDCKARYYQDFIEAGITLKTKMVDKNGRQFFNSVVTPEKCAKLKP